jgi:hypothetical protein
MERRKFLGVLPVAAGGALIMRSGEAPAQTTQSTGIWTNVKAYGAVGDGVTDDTAAIYSAIDFLQQNTQSRGGVLYFPVGQYKCSSPLSFAAYVPPNEGGVHNIIIRGDGPQCTTIDFTAAGSGDPGITFNAGAQFGIEDILINGAPGNGVVIGNGNSVGADGYCAFFTIRNVRVQNCGINGFLFINAYMGTMSDCWSAANAGIGFLFAGYHTSIDVNRCYASGNTGIGWSLNGMTYSSFTACGSDNNVWGYAMTNMLGVTFTSCGSESNQREGWLLETSTASTAGLPSEVNDIHGVTFTSCSSYSNGQYNVSPGPANTYGSHIAAIAQNSRPIVFKVSGNTSFCASGSSVSMVMNGSGGPITVYDELSYFSGTWVTSGSVTHKIL